MTIQTRLPGRIIAVNFRQGDRVQKGDVVAWLDAMKLENPVTATADGTVSAVFVQAGDTLRAGSPVMEIDLLL
ncbi:MAG: acetyl-CoA carboxylase biotin carboxyl carrier protein subunit [Eubacteriales bacterium]|nr:acetyl-CoA carboxylase biotin carboxyl carrier protein subunit [Eubacteriales bacterium]